MIPTSGDAMVNTADPGHITIYIPHRPPVVITVNPTTAAGSWQDYVEHVARPALLAAGWSLDHWHRPRNNVDLLCCAFVWRT